MNIEMLETVKHEQSCYCKGEIRIVDDNIGEYFCKCGWAKDVKGKIRTGERNIGASEITLNNSTQDTKAEEIN